MNDFKVITLYNFRSNVAIDEVVESFDDLPLHENLLRGIYSYGFEKPSAIQQRGIKPILIGRDTIGQAFLVIMI